MKYEELKNNVLENKFKEEMIEYKYVPLVLQQTMTDGIKSICVIVEDENCGLVKVNYSFKNLFQLLYTLVNFTNIEFPEDLYLEENKINIHFTFEIYDFFVENKLDKIIYNQEVIKDFIDLLDKEIEQEIAIKNSVSFVLANVLNSIANKIPSEDSVKSLMNGLPTLLNSINVNNTPIKKRSPRKTKE